MAAIVFDERFFEISSVLQAGLAEERPSGERLLVKYQMVNDMQGDTFTVLLVEDSPLLSQRLLEFVATMPGINAIGSIATESDAIAAIDAQRPDAVLLDLSLKQGTGFGVMRHINKLAGKRPAVIVMTNYALPQYRAEAASLGVQFFLDKSQELDQIPDALESVRSGAIGALR